jgi:hypothetical protein
MEGEGQLQMISHSRVSCRTIVAMYVVAMTMKFLSLTEYCVR